ncbi:MAG: hypothetical protein JSS96_12830 [Bacteroidetes bacterium]|nr:hypothetical protein [Bacteroidota bacterium]
MKTKSLLVLFLITCFLASCAKIYLRVTGNYKTPKQEDAASLKTYCSKYHAQYDLLFTPKSNTDFILLLKKFPNIPTTLIYDNEGNLVAINSGSSCPWQTLQKFKALNDSSKNLISVDKSNNFSDILSYIRCTDGDSSLLNSSTYDYLMVYTWAKFTPKLSKAMFTTATDVKQAAHFKVKIVAIDMDEQKGW